MNLNFNAQLTSQNQTMEVTLSENNQLIGSAFTDVIQVGGNIDDVKVNGESVVINKVAEVVVPTKTSDLVNDSGFIDDTYHDSSKQDLLTNENAGANITITTVDNILKINSTGGVTDWPDVREKPFESIDHNTLKVEDNVLKVNTVDEADEDKTQPITSKGVYVIVGNINALLESI